jgi:hypothetical protein
LLFIPSLSQADSDKLDSPNPAEEDEQRVAAKQCNNLIALGTTQTHWHARHSRWPELTAKTNTT